MDKYNDWKYALVDRVWNEYAPFKDSLISREECLTLIHLILQLPSKWDPDIYQSYIPGDQNAALIWKLPQDLGGHRGGIEISGEHVTIYWWEQNPESSVWSYYAEVAYSNFFEARYPAGFAKFVTMCVRKQEDSEV